MASLDTVKKMFVNAHKAGDFDAARKLAAMIRREEERQAADPLEAIPGVGTGEVPGTIPTQPAPTLGDKIAGVGEAALTLGTGATTGLLGHIEGAVEGIVREIATGEFGSREAANRIEQLALKRAQQLTYAPSTQPGQEMVDNVGEALSALAPLAPLAETQAIAQAARQVPLRATVTEPVNQIAQVISQKVRERLPQRFRPEKTSEEPEAAPVSTVEAETTPQQPLSLAEMEPPPPREKVRTRLSAEVKTRGSTAPEQSPRTVEPALKVRTRPEVQEGLTTSASLAKEALAKRRQEEATSLPVPIKLTKGDRERNTDQQKIERELEKLPEGQLLRERREENNLKIQQNMDAFIDETGAELTVLRGVGEAVNAALRKSAAKDKNQIRVLYKEAEKAGEMEAPVTIDSFANHLAENWPEAEVANILKAAKAKALQLKIITEGPEGEIIPVPTSLKKIELLRRSINNATNAEPTNIRQAGIMKGLIDEATEGEGGAKYRRARQARVKYAKKYENVSLIKNLLGTKKGTDDRAIALEDVVRKSILEPSTSLDSMKKLRSLLRAGGSEGQQAWRELQGATLRHIKETMLTSATNERSDYIVSSAKLSRVLDQLDKSGKLETLFTKKGAKQLRVLRDVAQYVTTAPPGTINTSNTATVIAALLDVALTGMSGIPAPVATTAKLAARAVRDRKLRARIQEALSDE